MYYAKWAGNAIGCPLIPEYIIVLTTVFIVSNNRQLIMVLCYGYMLSSPKRSTEDSTQN